MKSLTIVVLGLALTLLQAGCVATEPKISLQSALLIQPTASSTTVLNTTISRALNGARVSVAQDALTNSSELQIDRMAQDPAGMPGLNGRLMGMPVAHRFSLKKNHEGVCYLVYQKTGVEYLLDGVTCRAL